VGGSGFPVAAPASRRCLRGAIGRPPSPSPPRAAVSVAGSRSLRSIRAQVAAAEREVLAAAAQDPIATALQAIPGVGPVLALMIHAEVGDVQRFPTPGHRAMKARIALARTLCADVVQTDTELTCELA
jgi:transposase